MNVLLLSEIYPPQTGGSGRWLYEIYRRMPPDSVIVAAGKHPLAERYDRQSGIRTVRLPLHLDKWGILGLQSATQYWRLTTRIRNLIRKHECRELHVARCLHEGFVAWILKSVYRIPYVVYVHGEETRTSATSRELTWMTNRAYGSAKYLVANSHNTARILQEEWGVSPSRIRVLHPGVDTSRFIPTAASDQIRQKLGWHGRSVILTVGRLQIRKGHDMLIRTLPGIRQYIPDVLDAVAGDGEERGRLEALADELDVKDNVQFLGELTDDQLVECYQQCDVFALPNREVDGDFEGFGMVLVEAQACGKPVVAGDSGGTHETMDVGKTGLVGNCNSPAFLEEALMALLRDQSRRVSMGISGREWVLRHFDWPSLAKQAEEIFGIENVGAK
jgi:phosphatidylinositol alpha-1,6-mannosyltransferase